MMIPATLKELQSYAAIENEAGAIGVDKPDYTPEEVKYLTALRQRLTSAKTQRDANHPQFDGMTYVERCEQNRRLAQTAVKPRTNRAEIEFSAGTPRVKLIDHLAHLANLSLGADITAFDENNFAVAEMGESIENILEKQEELDNGEEKRVRRFYTLFEQGEVFAEREWKDGWMKQKTLQGKFTGNFRGVKWNTHMKKGLGRLMTSIIRNEHVYLGNMTLFDMDEQPYIFVRKVLHYTDLEPVFGKFTMWKYVQMTIQNWDSAFASNGGLTSFNPFWMLDSVKKGFVEVIIYQSNIQHDNELQVLLNGIPMFPPGFPLPWKHGQYSIVKQVAEIIDEHFAYGKSLMQRLKLAGGLEDEMWRSVFVSFQQMIKPPLINNTGTVLSSRIFMPGTIVNNIPTDKLKPLLEGMRNPRGEAEVLRMVSENLNQHSSSPQFSGQSPAGDPTATEVSAVQGNAEKIFGLAILIAALLEQKLTLLGIDLILENYFDPVDQKVDKVRDTLRNVYRTSNIQKPIQGRGMGQEVVAVTDKESTPSPFQVFDAERKISGRSGMPTRIIVLNRDQILASRWTWRARVVPRPRRTTNLQKLMFREEVDIFMLSPNFDIGWFEEKAAITYGENPEKVFKRQAAAPGAPGAPAGGPDATNPGGMPKTDGTGQQDPRMGAARNMQSTRKPTVNTIAAEQQ